MGIRLSNKHGVNPSVMICFYCNNPKGKGVALLGALPGDAEAPRAAVFDKKPCDECAAHMEAGIIFISVKDETPSENPYRTGGWCVLREEAVRRMLNAGETVEDVCHKRVAFIPDAVWDAIGLPREKKE